jgi:uncharacterized protein YdaU (DUF1376 family)
LVGRGALSHGRRDRVLTELIGFSRATDWEFLFMAPRLTGLWWWIDRWRKSSAFADMTLEEQGAYRNLLDEGRLRGGPLPNDERILAKACGDATRWRKVRNVVLAHFELGPDGWRNATLDEVIKESALRAEKQREYRNRLTNLQGHTPDNDVGNAADNNHRPPDPDPEIRGRARHPDRRDPGHSRDLGSRAAPGRRKRPASASLTDAQQQQLAKYGLD